MPQKRNPYALSIVRGASGVLIGRLSGFLAVTKSPSARSDNFIFAYGEVPRALDLSQRVTRLMSGVVRTLKVHPDRMESELYRGYAQSTDLAEYLTVSCGVDYRTAYVVVGNAVREASKAGIPGRELTVEMINAAAQAHAGSSWNIGADELAQILDARQIVNSRQAVGGAAPEAFAAMIASSCLRVNELRDLAQRKLAGYDAAETELLDRARAAARRTGDEAPARDSH
jgi:argininosuccinate lyase